jgi:hypothetical protein
VHDCSPSPASSVTTFTPNLKKKNQQLTMKKKQNKTTTNLAYKPNSTIWLTFAKLHGKKFVSKLKITWSDLQRLVLESMNPG